MTYDEALIEEINAAYRRLSAAAEDLARADRELAEHVRRIRLDNAGLVTIYNDRGTASLHFWRGVFERRAPQSLSRVERAALVKVSHGNVAYQISEELLGTLTEAYREAASGRIG